MKATDIDILYTTDINTMQVVLTTNRNPEYQQKNIQTKRTNRRRQIISSRHKTIQKKKKSRC